MTTNPLRNVTAAALAVAGILACGPASALQRAFVSSLGNDANTASSCVLTFPCRTFAGAMSVIDEGGEIIALDAAGYAVVNITKGVTIVANPGFYAGITAGGGNGITINAPTKNVLLKGLNINALGGVVGINVIAAASVTIDNCVIANFSGSGVQVDAAAVKVRISNTVLSSNGQDGLEVRQGRVDVVGSRANGNTRGGFSAVTTGGGAVATLTVTDSTASGNNYGFYAKGDLAASTAQIALTRVAGTSNLADGLRTDQNAGATTAIVGNSVMTENGAYGMNNVAGILRSSGNNVVDFNTTAATIGSITVLGGI